MVNKNKLILRFTIVLQVVYLIIIFLYEFFSNTYTAFLISITLNILCIILNFANIYYKGHFKILLLLITFCEILITAFIFLILKSNTPMPI